MKGHTKSSIQYDSLTKRGTEKKSVRNHIFVINSIICDVLSSVKNPPIYISVMDYRQMFDSESLQVCLNALYESGVQDDTLALINEANKKNVIAVKTPSGLTEKKNHIR